MDRKELLLWILCYLLAGMLITLMVALCIIADAIFFEHPVRYVLMVMIILSGAMGVMAIPFAVGVVRFRRVAE